MGIHGVDSTLNAPRRSTGDGFVHVLQKYTGLLVEVSQSPNKAKPPVLA